MKRIKGKKHYYKDVKGNKTYIVFRKHFTLPNGKSKIVQVSNSEVENYKDENDIPKKITHSELWEEKKNKVLSEYTDKTILLGNKKSTFKDMSKQFDTFNQTFKVGTYLRKKNYWDLYIYPEFKDSVIFEMESHVIDDLYNELYLKKGLGLVLEVHSVLNSFFNWLIESKKKVIHINPISKAKIKELRRKEKNAKRVDNLTKEDSISLESIKYILKEVQGTKEELIYHLQILHGLRIGEALGMTYENIRLADNIIEVRQQALSHSLSKLKDTQYNKKSYASIDTTKTENSERMITLQPATREAIDRVPESERKGLVFKTIQGKLCSRNNWTKRHFNPLMKRLGLNIKTHQLRKFFGSYHITQGTDIKSVQKMLGHTQLSTTMNIYVREIEGLSNKNEYLMSDLAI